MKPIGIVVPIVTPCTVKGEVDVEGLKAVCADMIGAGCHAIFVAGTTGRGPWFARPDRVKMCRAVADVVQGKMPVLAGCMGAGLKDMADNAKAMSDAGATLAVATIPMYFKYSAEEVQSLFLQFADASPLPVVVYDMPQLTGMKLAPELVLRLASHPNIKGLKDSSADKEKFEALLRLLKGREDFFILQGKEHILMDSLLAGASGFVISLLHVDSRPFVKLHRAVQDGNLPEARRFQKTITEVLEVLVGCVDRRPETSTLFFFLNAALKKRGIDVNLCLNHEGACPDWIEAEAQKALDLCRAVVG